MDKTIEKIYFIGIGGIGMSALARYMRSIGMKVYGYDKTKTELTKKLVDEGMVIHYEDDVSAIPEGIDLVVYTPAIPKDHLELNYFLSNGFEVIKRAEMLGRLSKVRKTIAIAGTHGKTSTSATTAHLLKYGKKDVSAFIGGIMSNYNSNYIEGKGDWIVVEADEFDRSFLHLEPEILAVMSVDADHLDIYGDHQMMKSGFEAFIKKIKSGGMVILKDGILGSLSSGLLEELNQREVKILTFGIDAEEDIKISNISVEEGHFWFDYKCESRVMKGLKTNLAGRHNIENAAVAITIGFELGLEENQIREGLSSFLGIKRRFEKIFEDEYTVYIDDYAHHPTELTSAISAAKELYKGRRVTGIFQPHLFSRTRDFAKEFAQALDLLDEVILMDIYPAREVPIEGVSSQIIFDFLTIKNKRLVSKEQLLKTIEETEFEILLTLGAGDIDVFVTKILEHLKRKRK